MVPETNSLKRTGKPTQTLLLRHRARSNRTPKSRLVFYAPREGPSMMRLHNNISRWDCPGGFHGFNFLEHRETFDLSHSGDCFTLTQLVPKARFAPPVLPLRVKIR